MCTGHKLRAQWGQEHVKDYVELIIAFLKMILDSENLISKQ